MSRAIRLAAVFAGCAAALVSAIALSAAAGPVSLIDAVKAGDVATAGDGEVHWFENPYDDPFAFYELWVPAPKETIWVRADDI